MNGAWSMAARVRERVAAFPSARLHNLLYGLLYPAFLGSLIYNYIDQRSVATIQAGLVLVALLLLFALDYVYSHAEEIVRTYSAPQFAIDLLVVLLLYIAAKSISGDRLISGMAPWGALLLSRTIAAVWEELQYQHLKKVKDASRSRRHANSDWLVAACYLVVGQIGWSWQDAGHLCLLLLPPLLIDVGAYLYNMAPAPARGPGR